MARAAMVWLLAVVPACALHLERRAVWQPAHALQRLRGGELQEDGDILSIETEEELAAVLDEAGSKMVVVDFYAEWCGPCKKIAPLIHSLAHKAGSKVVFVKVDVDNARELAESRGVKSMPTIQFFRKGVKVDQIVGADKARLKETVGRATMPPLVRLLSGERLLTAAAAAYIVLFANPFRQPRYG